MQQQILPILFSTDMVRANNEGRKTQTRRLIQSREINENPDEWNFAGFGTNPDNDNDKRFFAYFRKKDTDTWTYVLCPYGEPGAILWVREAFREKTYNLPEGIITEYLYKADDYNSYKFKWKPSIHMPREACRTYLHIKGIKMERLNQISDTDAVAEGIDFEEIDGFEGFPPYRSYLNYLPGKDFITLCDDAGYSWNYGKETHTAAVASFCSLWCEINGGEDSWNANPWVWVIEYERSDSPEKLHL